MHEEDREKEGNNTQMTCFVRYLKLHVVNYEITVLAPASF